MKTNIILVAVLCTQPFSLACAEGTEHEVHYLLGNDWRADKGLMFMKEGSSDDELYFNPGKFEEDGVIDNRRSLFGEAHQSTARQKLSMTR